MTMLPDRCQVVQGLVILIFILSFFGLIGGK